MTFTVEEISLLLEVDHSNIKAAMETLIALLKITESAELRSQFRQLGGKLYAMSNKDFETVDFDSWKEDFDAENE